MTTLTVPSGVEISVDTGCIEASAIIDAPDEKREWVAEWWRSNRKEWGRLQQLRKGTRVPCPYCKAKLGRRGLCQICYDGFWSRDQAIDHCLDEMEMANK